MATIVFVMTLKNMLINIEFHNPQANKYLSVTVGIYLKAMGSVSYIMIEGVICIMIYP